MTVQQMSVKPVIIAILILSGCETTNTHTDRVELPPVAGPAVVDVPVAVEDHARPERHTATPDVPFEGEGVGITPAGCRELRERDPKANC